MINKLDKRKRTTTMKVVFYIAITSYVLSLVSCGVAYLWHMEYGPKSPIYASALACIFFFLSCGVVLHTIANTNVPSFNVDNKDDGNTKSTE